MKKLLPLVLVVMLAAACAPPRTPAPTTAPPQPTAARPSAPAVTPMVPPATATSSAAAGTPQAPSPTPKPIEISKVEKAKQPNGEIRTTAEVSTAETLGLGEVEVHSPDKMAVGDTATIRLRLSPAAQLAALTPVAVPPGKTPDLPNFVYKFKGNVDLYPLMIAELRAITFVTNPTGQQRRILQGGSAVEWSWLARATQPGQHDLAIELSIPAIIEGRASEISTSVLQDVPLRIDVAPAGSQLPAATPASPWDNAAKSIADNAGAIVVALIGLAGTLIGLWYKARSEAKGSKE